MITDCHPHPGTAELGAMLPHALIVATTLIDPSPVPAPDPDGGEVAHPAAASTAHTPASAAARPAFVPTPRPTRSSKWVS